MPQAALSPVLTAANADEMTDFFTKTLAEADPDIFAAVQKETGRQQDQIELIASENIVSRASGSAGQRADE